MSIHLHTSQAPYTIIQHREHVLQRCREVPEFFFVEDMGSSKIESFELPLQEKIKERKDELHNQRLKFNNVMRKKSTHSFNSTRTSYECYGSGCIYIVCYALEVLL
jgi:hypothetical protein